MDFAETFLDAAGVSIPGDMQGLSLVPLLKGETPADWRKSFYYHYYEFPGAHSVARHFGVTTGEHKLIHFYHNDEWELFDLKKDPEELRSVYGRSGYADVERALKKELERLRGGYKLPESEERPGARQPRKKKNENRKPK